LRHHDGERRACRRTPGPGFNFNIEEWIEGDRYETLAICRTLALALASFSAAVAEKSAGRFTVRSTTRVVKRHPEGNW